MSPQIFRHWIPSHYQQNVSYIIFLLVPIITCTKDVSDIVCCSFLCSQPISSLIQQDVSDAALLSVRQPHTITGSELHCDSILEDNLITPDLQYVSCSISFFRQSSIPWTSVCEWYCTFSGSLTSNDQQFVSAYFYQAVTSSYPIFGWTDCKWLCMFLCIVSQMPEQQDVGGFSDCFSFKQPPHMSTSYQQEIVSDASLLWHHISCYILLCHPFPSQLQGVSKHYSTLFCHVVLSMIIWTGCDGIIFLPLQFHHSPPMTGGEQLHCLSVDVIMLSLCLVPLAWTGSKWHCLVLANQSSIFGK